MAYVQVEGRGMAALDRALREFKKSVETAGIMGELHRRKYFQPKWAIRKRKRLLKREKSLKNG